VEEYVDRVDDLTVDKFTAEEEIRLAPNSLAECKSSAWAYPVHSGEKRHPVFEYFKAKYPHLPWYRNVDREPFLSKYAYLVFLVHHNCPLPRTFLWIQNTGMFSKELESRDNRQFFHEAMNLYSTKVAQDWRTEEEGGMSLGNSSVGTVFILACLFLALSSLVFCAESLSYSSFGLSVGSTDWTPC